MNLKSKHDFLFLISLKSCLQGLSKIALRCKCVCAFASAFALVKVTVELPEICRVSYSELFLLAVGKIRMIDLFLKFSSHLRRTLVASLTATRKLLRENDTKAAANSQG